MNKYTIYMSFEKGPGCLQIMSILQRNPYLKDHIDLVKISSKNDMIANRLIGLPAVKIPDHLKHVFIKMIPESMQRNYIRQDGTLQDVLYGTMVEMVLESMIKKVRPTEGGSVDGTSYTSLNTDDAVTFDPRKIHRAEDFHIPSGPVVNIDLETLIAQQKADRQILDTEIGTGRKPY